MRASVFVVALAALIHVAVSHFNSKVGKLPLPGSAEHPSSRKLRRGLSSRHTCPLPVEVPTTAPKPTPFYPLSADEIDAIVEWLSDPSRGLNLTDATKKGLAQSDNYIAHIETLKPNKTDVLAYLDGDSSMPRYARVVLHEGAKPVPVIAEYFVSDDDAVLDINFIETNTWLARTSPAVLRFHTEAAGLFLQWCQWTQDLYQRRVHFWPAFRRPGHSRGQDHVKHRRHHARSRRFCLLWPR